MATDNTEKARRLWLWMERISNEWKPEPVRIGKTDYPVDRAIGQLVAFHLIRDARYGERCKRSVSEIALLIGRGRDTVRRAKQALIRDSWMMPNGHMLGKSFGQWSELAIMFPEEAVSDPKALSAVPGTSYQPAAPKPAQGNGSLQSQWDVVSRERAQHQADGHDMFGCDVCQGFTDKLLKLQERIQRKSRKISQD